MLTDLQRKYIVLNYQDMFTDGGLVVETMKMEQPELYKELINSAIEDEGFPSDADHTNVPHQLHVKFLKNHEEMADAFIEFTDIDDDPEAFDDIKDNLRMYSDYIMTNIFDYFEFEVELKMEIEEFIDASYSIEAIATEIEKQFDDVILEQAIERLSPSYREHVYEAVKSTGEFPDNVDPFTVDVNIVDIEPKASYTDIAELIQEYIPEDESPASFIDSGRFLNIAIGQHDAYAYGIEVVGNPEDYELEE